MTGPGPDLPDRDGPMLRDARASRESRAGPLVVNRDVLMMTRRGMREMASTDTAWDERDGQHRHGVR